jgi:pimeloyl-ACP methyl ester carboxylesterase
VSWTRAGACSVAAAGVSAASLPTSTESRFRETGQVLQAGDVTLYYEVRGNGRGLPLFLVNGGPGFEHTYMHCSTAWDQIGKTRKLVFYDQRGNGRSGPLHDGETCTLADQVADLDSLRARLGYSEIDLLGHSWAATS